LQFENPTGLLNLPTILDKKSRCHFSPRKSGSLLQVFVDGQHHVGSELLGSQAIATTDAHNVGLGHGLQGGTHLQKERLTLRALLLAPKPWLVVDPQRSPTPISVAK